MKRTAIIAVLAAVAAPCMYIAVAVNPTAASADTPPQGCTIRIENPSGATWWARFTGSGSGGLSPLEEGVCGHGPLVVDGAFLHPSGCGLKTQPCVIVWRNSPQP